MEKITFVCDSSCDLSPIELVKRGVGYVPLSLSFDGGNSRHCQDISPCEFYRLMREGHIAKTAGVNVNDFIKVFQPLLDDECDIIYLGLSSALSSTFNAARLAAAEMRARYPRRKIALIDTLCASAGIALMLDLLVKTKDCGASFDEIENFLLENCTQGDLLITMGAGDIVKVGEKLLGK